MFKAVSPYFIILGCAMHLFCCGIPLFLSVTGLTTLLGITSLSVFEIEWFEAVENYVLVFSGILLLITYAADCFSKKIDCLEDGFCAHEPCEDKKNFSTRVLHVTTVLFVINLMVFGYHTFIG